MNLPVEVKKSELEPQRELDLASVSARNRVGNDPCCRADVTARENNQIGVTKVRVIESVEDLHPELQIQLLFQRNPLEQRSIQVPHAWPAEGISPRHRERPWSPIGNAIGIIGINPRERRICIESAYRYEGSDFHRLVTLLRRSRPVRLTVPNRRPMICVRRLSTG